MESGHSWFSQNRIRSTNFHRLASNAPRRIRNDLHQVVRGLVPLMENSTIGPVSTEPLASWLRQQTGDAQDTISPNPAENPGPPNENFIIDIEGSYPLELAGMRELEPSSTPTSQVEEIFDTSQTNNNNNNSNNNNNENNATTNNHEFQALMNLGEKYIPIVIILLMKLIFDHRIGLLLVSGLIITFHHSNSVVKREVAKQNARQLGSLLVVIANLTICICLVYLVLSENNLALALIFIPPYDEIISLWDVLWIVTVTDLNLKLITIMLKTVILALPAPIVAFQKKGKHYLFIESLSQLYRTLAPMQHWLYFFSESYSGSSKIFGVILSATYLFSKGKDIMNKTKSLKKSFSGLLESTNYGVKPSSEEIKSASNTCPICQDEFKSPTMLHCKHIFCEECVTIWFDRERTCPMCRAEIADDPSWRDGATSCLIQVM